MSVLRINSELHLAKFKNFVDTLPKTYVSFLSRVAGRARELFRNDLLSGQALTFYVGEKDSIGRFTIKGKVAPHFSMIFTSYPLNLFERGRTLRDGRKEPGKYILTRQFKSLLNSNLQGFSDSAIKRTIDKEAAKA